MTRIRNAGAGGPTPTGGPEPTESTKDTSATNQTTQTGTDSQQLTPQRQVATDKFAAADLKAVGNQIKSHLESQLENKTADPKKTSDASLSPEQLAALAAKGQQTFAPPYVPVGPVVMGDNISIPASSESTQLNLKADQFQINEQGNLVITNEKLIEYFKSLKETGKDILLGITNLKLPGEE